jgi:hypothetical protein
MNARIYASLFRWQDKVLLVVFTFFLTTIAFIGSVPTRHGAAAHADSIIFLLMPPVVLGSLLAGIWNRPLQRPASALCPHLQDVLFRWHAGFVVAAAIIWVAITHGIEPAMPLVAALGIAGAMFTLPLALGVGQPPAPTGARLVTSLWAIIVGANLGSSWLKGWQPAFLAHTQTIGTAGFVLAAFNLWHVRKRKAPARTTRTPSTKEATDILAWLRSFLRGSRDEPVASFKNTCRLYPKRESSLRLLIRGAAEESPLGWSALSGLMLGPVLFHPWVNGRIDGYPLGWYHVVYSPNGTQASLVALIVASVAFSLRPGLLRADALYPLSRQRRAEVAFATSATSFALNYAVLAGGSTSLAAIVGWYFHLPMPADLAGEFLVRMAMVLPFMPLVRRAALSLEESQNFFAILFLIGSVMSLLFLAQMFVLRAGLAVGAIACIAAIVVSQLAYYGSLRRFYTTQDLIRRDAIRPTLVEA